MTIADFWVDGVPPAKQPTDDAIATLGALVAFQAHVCTFLRSWTPLGAIPAQSRPYAITYADHATIEANIAKSMQSIGISLLVDLTTATKKSAMRNACCFQPFGFQISIIESPTLNRSANGTKLPCKHVAEQVALCLEGAALGNGQCDLKGLQFPTDDIGLQKAVVSFETALVVTLPGLT
jgi:hypothetical protein